MNNQGLFVRRVHLRSASPGCFDNPRRQATFSKQEKGDGMKGGRPRYYVEEPTCETFTRLCEKTSCISSSLSHFTHLRKLAPHFTHFEPSPFFHPPFPVCLQTLNPKPPEAPSAQRSPRIGEILRDFEGLPAAAKRP